MLKKIFSVITLCLLFFGANLGAFAGELDQDGKQKLPPKEGTPPKVKIPERDDKGKDKDKNREPREDEGRGNRRP